VINQHHIMQGSDNVARWWQIVEQLHVQKIIFDGRDFELQDGYLYIKIQNVHPLYTKEMIAQRDANELAKSTQEYYLKLDKATYVDKKKKRFSDGSNADCMQFVYNRLSIDLIRIPGDNYGMTEDDRAYRYKQKYREMGLDENGMPLPGYTVKSDVPEKEITVEQSSFSFGDDNDPLTKNTY